MRLYPERQLWRRTTGFFLVEERAVPDWPHTQPHLLQPTDDKAVMSWVRQPEGFQYAQPSFSLTEGDAQDLFDLLYQQGYRPRDAIDEASRLKATQDHLADMRSIAFGKLNIPAPGASNVR